MITSLVTLFNNHKLLFISLLAILSVALNIYQYALPQEHQQVITKVEYKERIVYQDKVKIQYVDRVKVIVKEITTHKPDGTVIVEKETTNVDETKSSGSDETKKEEEKIKTEVHVLDNYVQVRSLFYVGIGVDRIKDTRPEDVRLDVGIRVFSSPLAVVVGLHPVNRNWGLGIVYDF